MYPIETVMVFIITLKGVVMTSDLLLLKELSVELWSVEVVEQSHWEEHVDAHLHHANRSRQVLPGCTPQLTLISSMPLPIVV